MEYDGQQQMDRDEQPRTQADLHSVVGDEEEHHEKKPMMTRMKNKMRRMKDSMTKKMHGHADDHDVHDDDEHSVESEGSETRTTPRGLGGGDKLFTTDRRDEHIDLGTKDPLGGRDDPLPLSSRGEHVPLSSRDDHPVTLASRDLDIPLGGLGSRDERPVSLGDREERATLGGLQEPPVTLDADPVDPLRNDSVSRSEDDNISDPKTGHEQSVSSDVLSSFQDMDISSDVEKKPSYTEKLSSTAARVEESEEKPSYTEKLTATAAAAKDAAVSAASTVYAKGTGGTHSGETHDQFVTPGSTGSGVEVEPREGAGEEKGNYTEKLPTTPVALKDAAVSAASNVHAMVAGGIHSGETHDQFATPGSTGPGVEVELREGAGEQKGNYTEKLSSTAVAAKDAALSAASTVYAKVAVGTHSGETHDQIATPGSISPGVEVEPREGVGEEMGSYTEKLSSTAVAAKDSAVSAASSMYAKVAGGTHSGEPHDEIATQGSTGPRVEVEPREGAGEEKGSYTEKLPATVVAAKDAAVSAASTVYTKVTGGSHSGETHDKIATPVSTGPGVEVEPREGAAEKEETYMEMFTGTAWAVKDAAVNAASTVYGKMTWAGTAVQPEGETEQEKGVSVREYLAEKLRPGEDDKALCEVISESRKKKGVEEDKVPEVKGRIVLPEVTAGEIGVKRVVGTEGGGDGEY